MEQQSEVNSEANGKGDIKEIDPRDWLTHDESQVFGYVDTRAGRLKIAPLTEKESDQIRRGAQGPVPGNPKQTQVNLKKLRTMMVCWSLNKAAGLTNTADQIRPEQLDVKLSGEITSIVNEISKLSGFDPEGGQGEDLNQFLSVS